MAVARELKSGGFASACAVGGLGLVFGALLLRRVRSPSRRHESDDEHGAWADYLRDHLAGADAAIQVVDQLKHTYQGTREGALFGSLHEQFLEDRAVVTALLADLGASRLSVKRLAGHATGSVLKAVAGGKRGGLSLFRTLEALAIGVQGKRCLWRAAQVHASPVRAPGGRSFIELEADAVSQWEAIEQCRRSLVPQTFAL